MNDDVYCSQCKGKMEYLCPLFYPGTVIVIGEVLSCENLHTEPRYFKPSSK